MLTPEGRALRDNAERVPGCILEATALTAENTRRLTEEIARLRNALGKAN